MGRALGLAFGTAFPEERLSEGDRDAVPDARAPLGGEAQARGGGGEGRAERALVVSVDQLDPWVGEPGGRVAVSEARGGDGGVEHDDDESLEGWAGEQLPLQVTECDAVHARRARALGDERRLQPRPRPPGRPRP